MARIATLALIPLLALFWAVAFILDLEEAPRAARVVPTGVAFVLAAIAALEALRVFVLAPGAWRSRGGMALDRDRTFAVLALLAYYPSFVLVGFHISNLLFLLAILAILRPGLKTTLIVALGTAGLVSGLAVALGFNLPTPMLFQ